MARVGVGGVSRVRIERGGERNDGGDMESFRSACVVHALTLPKARGSAREREPTRQPSWPIPIARTRYAPAGVAAVDSCSPAGPRHPFSACGTFPTEKQPAVKL